MIMSLAEKIRKARETTIEVGGFKFTIRRPTDVDMMTLRGTGTVDRLFPFVIGWDGVKEIDLIPGGNPVPVEFDAETFAEWASDRPDILGPLIDEIVTSYRKHAEKVETDLKN